MPALLPRSLALAVLFAFTIGRAADWPRFRGPGGAATSTEQGVPVTWTGTDGIAWKAELPGAGSSSPIIVGDRIFLTAYTGWNVPGQSGGSSEDLKRHVLCLN